MTKEAMISVKTNEFVAALKSLKMDQKRRRKLNILIRQGASFGELIFELSGNSPYSGVLTTIRSDGDWPEAILLPAGSLRGIVTHPPNSEKLQIYYDTGRFHVGSWSCPATSAEGSKRIHCRT